MKTYRKTQDGKWVVYAPASELPQPGVVTVTKKDGSTKTEAVERVSKPFDVHGIPHVYGFLAPRPRPQQRASSDCGCRCHWHGGQACFTCVNDECWE